MKKGLNIALLIGFVLTIMVPLTGVHIHKIASAVFLLLCIVHAVIYRMKLDSKILLLLFLVVTSFTTGLLGIVLDQFPIALILHRCISIAAVFFGAIHIFIHYRKLHN